MSFTNSDPRKLRQQIIPSDIHFVIVYTVNFIQSNSTSFPQILLTKYQGIKKNELQSQSRESSLWLQ